MSPAAGLQQAPASRRTVAGLHEDADSSITLSGTANRLASSSARGRTGVRRDIDIVLSSSTGTCLAVSGHDESGRGALSGMACTQTAAASSRPSGH